MNIPLAEIQLDFVRSSGPGGQKVNKTSSKVQLRWNVGESAAFTLEEKAMIASRLRTRINLVGEIVLASDQFRSQSQNKEFVLNRLGQLVAQALTRSVKRIATRPTRASKKKRIEMKKRISEKKIQRRTLTRSPRFE